MAEVYIFAQLERGDIGRMSYLLLLHILSAIIFVGNIITAAYWKLRAERTKERTYIHRTARDIMSADYFFTIPSVLFLLLSGFALSNKIGVSYHEINWLSISLLLFIITGLIYFSGLIPLQRKMIRYSSDENDFPKYYKTSRLWDVIGTIEIIIPLTILYLMVVKPF